MRWGGGINPVSQISGLRLRKCHDLPKASQREKSYFLPLCGLVISLLSLWLFIQIMACVCVFVYVWVFCFVLF